MKSLLPVVICLSALLTSNSYAQNRCANGICVQGLTGADNYAVRLNSIGRLVHDRSYRGPEVIYWSSTPATEAEAIASWKRSPGHARLVNSGQITDIQCYGNYCVGRGAASHIGLPKPLGITSAVANTTSRVVQGSACAVQQTANLACRTVQAAVGTTRNIVRYRPRLFRCR